MSDIEESQEIAGIARVLAELLDVAVFATRADLRRSGALPMLTSAATDAVAADIEPVTLIRANGSRRGCSVYNDSSATLYVKLGAGASVDDWTVKLADGDYYEPPAGYRGELSGVWSSAAGQARVAEFN